MPLTSAIYRIILTLSLISLIAVAGCGHVAGNYPVQARKQPSLPAEFKSPMGHDTTLIWVEESRIHGFLSFWRDTKEHADTFRRIAAQSGLEVHRQAIKMYDKLSADGIAEMTCFVFFARDVSVTCTTGDFEITFGDGTVVRDVGILRYEPRDVNKPYRYTKDGAVELSSEPVGDKEPLPVIIFVPAEHLGKTVEAVTCSRAS